MALDTSRYAVVPRLAVVVLLALVALGAATRTRAESRWLEPRLVLHGQTELRAGDAVELRWDSSGEGIGELEILLLDASHHGRVLQVSPQLDPRRGVFVWRVPDLGRTVTAQLSIRYNRDGEEVLGEPGPALKLVCTRDLARPSALQDEPLAGGPEPPASPVRATTSPVRVRASESGDEALSHPRDAQRVVDPRSAPPKAAPAPAALSLAASTPDHVPLRN